MALKHNPAATRPISKLKPNIMNTVENINNYNYPSKNFFPAEISSISAWMRVVREADKQSDYQFIPSDC